MHETDPLGFGCNVDDVCSLRNIHENGQVEKQARQDKMSETDPILNPNPDALRAVSNNRTDWSSQRQCSSKLMCG